MFAYHCLYIIYLKYRHIKFLYRILIFCMNQIYTLYQILITVITVSD